MTSYIMYYVLKPSVLENLAKGGGHNFISGGPRMALIRPYCFRFRYSFICQGTSTRRQRSDVFGLRVKLSPVTISL